jgi:hypothetical protein
VIKMGIQGSTVSSGDSERAVLLIKMGIQGKGSTVPTGILRSVLWNGTYSNSLSFAINRVIY